MVVSIQKVLISDEVDQRCVEILQQNGIEAVKNTKLSKEELVKEIVGYDGLIVRSATKVTADVINAGSRLKIIGRAGTGVDNIDTAAATNRGVIVMNTPGGNTMSAAELTCTMVLVTSRHVAAGCSSLKEGRWDRKKYMGNEVLGKTLAIIGLGRIGKEVALRMQSFGMTTIGFDPIISAEEAAEFNTEWMSLEDIWSKADYITVHTPLIPQTKNLINDDVFSKCKKGVRIVNVARGGIVDEDALLRALESGQCGGAGLDVFLEEPPANKALIAHPLITCTPHLGASTAEAQSRVAMEIAQQFVDVHNGTSLFGAINAQAMMNALSVDTKPLVELGGALGKVAHALGAQLAADTEVKVVTQGKGVTKAGTYLVAAALVGLLEGASQNGYNLVSAPAQAKTLGVKVSSSHHGEDPDDYSPLITLVVQQPDGAKVELIGTVLHCTPALVSVQGAALEQAYQLQGSVLMYRSQANPQVLPAVIGAVSTQDSRVESLCSSKPVSGETYTLMRVLPPLAAPLDALKLHVTSVTQIRFH